MLTTKRKPVTVSEILVEEFLVPLGLSQDDLARMMRVSPELVHELCNDSRAVTPETAQMMERALGITADFWLNTQRREDLWDAMNIPTAANAHKRKAPVPLGELLAAVDTPEGRERLKQYLEGEPFPHFEQHPTRRNLLIKIEENGSRFVGRFVNRQFVEMLDGDLDASVKPIS